MDADGGRWATTSHVDDGDGTDDRVGRNEAAVRVRSVLRRPPWDASYLPTSSPSRLPLSPSPLRTPSCDHVPLPTCRRSDDVDPGSDLIGPRAIRSDRPGRGSLPFNAFQSNPDALGFDWKASKGRCDGRVETCADGRDGVVRERRTAHACDRIRAIRRHPSEVRPLAELVRLSEPPHRGLQARPHAADQDGKRTHGRQAHGMRDREGQRERHEASHGPSAGRGTRRVLRGCTGRGSCVRCLSLVAVSRAVTVGRTRPRRTCERGARTCPPLHCTNRASGNHGERHRQE